jgi:signal transduction histidine kinase
VRGYIGLLERDFGNVLGKDGRDYVGRIRSNVERITVLIDDLLALGSLDGPLEGVRSIDSREIFLQLAADLKPSLEEQRIDLVLPDHPPSVDSVWTLFYRVVSNLVQNAISHMGEVAAPQILVDLRPVKGGVELVVQDNGQGIQPALQRRIFERFFPHCSHGTRVNSGLGLAIVKRVMETHGGHVAVESTPGRGATFRAFFPRRQDFPIV